MEKMTGGFFGGELGALMWTDGWQISGKEVWFTSARMNCLFRMEQITGETVFVSKIPIKQFLGFRQYPVCVKHGELIFCLPNNAEEIWCYHISDDSWKEIEIYNPDRIRLKCVQAWCVKDKLYVVSIGLKQVIELDISRRCIDKYYNITEGGQEISLRSAYSDNCIYTVLNNPVGVCRFDCLTKERKLYLLHQVEDEISRIEFDGRKFWLGGKKKRIYIWEKNSNEVKILDQFPAGFGIYDFVNRQQPLLDYDRDTAGNWMFIDIRCIGSHVWLIPCDANEILYVDINTLEIRKFSIENEKRAEEDMEEPLMRCMYILEYVREKRYLGIYSLKNKCMYEIDTKKMDYKILDCSLDEKSVRQIHKIIQSMEHARDFFRKPVHIEREEDTLHMLIEALVHTYQGEEKGAGECCVGSKIYEYLCMK